MSRLETLQSDASSAVGPLAREIRELAPWFHNLHLADGTETAPDHPLGDFPAYKWRAIEAAIPLSFDGLSVLDIGCNAGFHAFQMSRLGASVVAVDTDEHYLRQARWAQQHVPHGAPVTFRQGSVYDVGRWNARYDLINFMGVLYHLRYPLLALDILANCCDRWMIFQSLSLDSVASEPPHQRPENLELSQREALREADWPSMAFIENRFAGDVTNWWVPNEPAVFAMLRSAGFEVRQKLGVETWLCERVSDRASPLELSL